MRLREQVRELGRELIGALAGAALLLAATPSFAEASAPAAASAPQSRAAAAAPRPAIWLLEDSDTKIYLFGTTHVFERGLAWRSPRLDAIIRDADELVMETGDEEEDVLDEGFAEAMFMDESVPILSRVSEPYRPHLKRIVEASGLGAESWDQLQTWAAGIMVMATLIMEGLTEEQRAAADPFETLSGAEVELAAEFRGAGKPISGVESGRLQMEMLRTLPDAAQQAFLESMLEDGEGGAAAHSEELDSAWVSGDVEAIAREMETMPPVLYEPLLTNRNRAWTEWLARRLERPGTVLFAVGAGHLTGRGSVQSMLAERGLTARRID